MCSGRVDPFFIFEAFKNGADAVMVGGCKLGECKYTDGNFQALVMAEMVWNLMRLIGISQERFKLEWVSSAEPVKLVEDMKTFMLKIKELGPLGEREGKEKGDLDFYLDSAIAVCKNMQVRTIYGSIAKELKKLRDFSLDTINKKVEEKLLPVLKNRLYEMEIKILIQDGPKSLDYLVQKTGAEPEELSTILNKIMKT